MSNMFWILVVSVQVGVTVICHRWKKKTCLRILWSLSLISIIYWALYFLQSRRY